MNRHDMLELQQIRTYPCVTITLPTHRTSPENKQDPIRVKNLLNQATERLAGEFSKREVEPLQTRLQALADEIDYQYLLDGLALFANNEYSRSFALPFTLDERVVVDETFFTRNLVFALNRTPRYWVLALGEDPTRLYEGTLETLTEVRGEGFPMSNQGPGGAQALPGGVGVNPSAIRDDYLRKFYRDVDNALKLYLADDPLPMVLVGVERNLAFFTEVTNHAASVLTTVTGAHERTSPHELGKLVWGPLSAALDAQRQQVMSELDQAIGARLLTDGVNQVWQAANEGRGRLLVVEQDYHFPARLDETGMQLAPADDPAAPGVMDDAVDEIIETVLHKGGRVRFVDDGQLETHQHIALILRY